MGIRKKALEFATRAHAGQKRKDGKDYITHPIAVAEIAEQLAKNFNITEESFLDDLYVVSLAHDLVEDVPQYEGELLEQFGSYILANVQTLSRQKNETYFDFIHRVSKTTRKTLDPLPLIVKISDIKHNLSDLQEGSLKDKYRFALYFLLKQLRSI